MMQTLPLWIKNEIDGFADALLDAIFKEENLITSQR